MKKSKNGLKNKKFKENEFKNKRGMSSWWIFLSIGFFILIILVLGYLFIKNPPRPAIGNPASYYCKYLNYSISKDDSKKSGIVFCVFPDNTSCDEWSFFNGICGINFSYCGIKGYELISSYKDEKGIYHAYSSCNISGELIPSFDLAKRDYEGRNYKDEK